jgi:RND superfamily putative drug exporter
VSPDGRTSYVAVNLPPLTSQELDKVSDALAKVREDATAPGFQVEIGGLAVEQESEGPPTEVIGNLAAVAILLLAFGSVFAMALPIAIGVFGALGGVAAVSLGANVVGMPAFAAPVATMIAIGVGIDYALLVVTRHREAMLAGATPQEAAVAALDSAGRSVLVAGTTVVIATVGLVVMDLKMITGVALGIGASVLITMLAAVTLLPALLALVGRRIDRLSLRRRGPVGGHGTLARRWSRQVQRHPVVWAVAASATLLLLAVPALDMRLGFSDAGTQPTTSTERRAYDLIGEGFGPGANGPLVVAVSEPADGGHRVARQLAARIADTTGVAEVSRPITGSSPTVALVTVVPTTGPRAEETTDLVHRLRDRVVPTVTAGTDARVAVGGSTAAAVDFADYNADRLPTFLAVILGLAFVLLTAVFRGVVVAAKAVLVNLLSIGASFGAVVAVFQWGWGVDLLNLGASGPFEAWAPMMLIAIVFGLSMDYEVFLLSRIREEYDAGRRNGDAVAAALARTARVITAAAAIMICVFGSFVLGSSRALQLFGFGLAFAVLIDATLVRMVLVPATMELLGDRNWWLPRWLERALPQVNIEPPLAVPDERRHADPALAQQSAGRD